MRLGIKKSNEKIGVAVSGGIDSMTLLYLYQKANQDIIVINFEHGIRGKSSRQDSLFVKDYCEKNNLDLLHFDLNVLDNRKQGESVETCARRLRYKIFNELLKNGTIKKIALAHHADDNLETVLMRLFRGTGIRGLVGITDHDNFIHPLLNYTRKEIEDYAFANKIPFVEDETNKTSDYTRNYLRNELIPLIKLKYSDVTNSVNRLSSIANETSDYLYSIAIESESITNGELLKGIFGYPKIVQKYSVLKCMHKFGIAQDFESKHIDYILSLTNLKTMTSIKLPFGLDAYRNKQDLYIYYPNELPFSTMPFSIDAKFNFGCYAYDFQKTANLVPRCTFDLDKLPTDCVIRTREPGDMFKHVNGHNKSLSDYLIDKKIQKNEKELLLVIAKDNIVYAILGIEVSDFIKIDDQSTNIYKINRTKII